MFFSNAKLNVNWWIWMILQQQQVNIQSVCEEHELLFCIRIHGKSGRWVRYSYKEIELHRYIEHEFVVVLITYYTFDFDLMDFCCSFTRFVHESSPSSYMISIQMSHSKRSDTNLPLYELRRELLIQQPTVYVFTDFWYMLFQ